VESKDNFGRFFTEPLEKGFGYTLGNALRRVLLGYLPGAAVTRLKIEGVHHEFSIIPHLKEDSTEFLLNVKTLRLKPLSGQPGKLILDVEGERQVSANDIRPSSDFEIANPELYLATLDSPEAKLYVEFDIELGTGYKEAGSSDNLPVETIPVDAVFTPMRKVNFTIDPIHAGLLTSHERLTLDIWTDGTISPIDALSRSADILIRQFSPFSEYARASQVELEQKALRLSIPEEQYNMPVEQLDLSVRTINCLRRANIATVGELITKKEKDLLRLRNFGHKSLHEIGDRLRPMGLSLTLDKEPIPTAENEVQEQIAGDTGEVPLDSGGLTDTEVEKSPDETTEE
jgi:DNA-directed RNA polymerase subunit alpha